MVTLEQIGHWDTVYHFIGSSPKLEMVEFSASTESMVIERIEGDLEDRVISRNTEEKLVELPLDYEYADVRRVGS